MTIINNFTIIIFIILCLFVSIYSQVQQDDFHISEEYNQEYENNQKYQSNDENSKRQMEYLSQRRTSCLVLSRYYVNQFNDEVQEIVNQLQGQDQQKFINKIYTTAVEKCEPLIQLSQIVQFFTQNTNFNPSSMFYIFDGFSINDLHLNYRELTPSQENILKFIKNFDSQMEIRKQEQEAQSLQSEREQGIELFFISIANLPASIKYLYIVIVILIAGSVLWWALSQIGEKPTKKINKRRKKQ